MLRNLEKIMMKAFPEASSMERQSWVVAPGFRVWWGVGPGPETIDTHKCFDFFTWEQKVSFVNYG